jgi:hypothetical protein
MPEASAPQPDAIPTLTCAKCGYLLRSVPDDAACPKCGLSKALSTQEYPVQLKFTRETAGILLVLAVACLVRDVAFTADLGPGSQVAIKIGAGIEVGLMLFIVNAFPRRSRFRSNTLSTAAWISAVLMWILIFLNFSHPISWNKGLGPLSPLVLSYLAARLAVWVVILLSFHKQARGLDAFGRLSPSLAALFFTCVTPLIAVFLLFQKMIGNGALGKFNSHLFHGLVATPDILGCLFISLAAIRYLRNTAADFKRLQSQKQTQSSTPNTPSPP